MLLFDNVFLRQRFFSGTAVLCITIRKMMFPWLQYINLFGLYRTFLVAYLFIFSCSLSAIHLQVFFAHL